MRLEFDVVVVGAGHAGCEAAVASANMGVRTCLITMDMNKIAQMSCNPAVGGIAKGQIVREIDALGGKMGEVTDACTLQFRMLNRSKGPAVWSPRAQCDRGKFIWKWREVLDNTDNLRIWQDCVCELTTKLTDDGMRIVTGVKTIWGAEISAKCVIITAGTFLNGLMHIGRKKIEGGRIAEPAAKGLTESLVDCGIRQGRMKTGTPVRIDKRSVDFSLMERQDGEEGWYRFSYLDSQSSLPHSHPELQHLPCWLCMTNEKVHEILKSGLADSPLYNGQIQSIGPRYCPSIETKLHTFPDKDFHQLFLEPEGETSNEMYLNGFSSSLPMEIQIDALRQIPCLKNVEVYRPGYAIEYDYFDPTQLNHTLESKVVKNLFLAGQVNGTTGYEEAAGQGLIAGINASLSCKGKDPFILHRNEAYIGVLIDDLVTKGVDEPYRMFTSRAEYRILLRQDDADMRLTEKSYKIGLASQERYDRMITKREKIENIIRFTENFSIKATYINKDLEKIGTTPLERGCKLIDLLQRPGITINNMRQCIRTFDEFLQNELEMCSNNFTSEILEATEIRIKYQGYINREQMVADKMMRLENIKIEGKFDYPNMSQISIEARQKLATINPKTLAQASRIPGVSPSDINAMLVLLGR
ncbi:MAG: tRNA uridine-5-carboxymethylaminomethyl(34) synthesis enzyme MnmG [Prevotellaceae bacterium]|nr:tRNA uridine-5-carboxymethylaminomethyl(34) synthesis enzyme MnmG [Candidatus Colivivens equi]